MSNTLAAGILYIGHGLVGATMPQVVETALRLHEPERVVQVQAMPGASLAQNWENAATGGVHGREALESGMIGTLIMTEAIPLAGQRPWSETYDNALRFYELAVEHNPDTQLFLYETWHSLVSGTDQPPPWGDDRAHIPWRERLDRDLRAWQGIVDHVNERRSEGAPEMRLIPAGQAMALMHDAIEAGTVPSIPRIDSLFVDDLTPNSLGWYFIAMVHYAAITGESPVGLPGRMAGVAPGDRLGLRMQEIAWEAHEHYQQGLEMRMSGGDWPPIPPPPAPARGTAAESYVALVDAAPAPAPVALAARHVGFGLNGISDWSTQQPFINVFKTARPWIGHLPSRFGGWETEELETQGYLGADGWPVAVPNALRAVSALILTDLPEDAQSLAGRYHLTYEGVGEITISGRVQNVTRHDPGHMSFDYTPGPGLVDIAITGTDPARTGDPIRNIAVVHEANLARHANGEIFNPLWLEHLGSSRALRFMDWMATNDSTLSNWTARPHPDDPSWTALGAPLEVMIALANLTGSDPWFTLPHLADDEFIRQFAVMVRDRLDPDLRAHVELSNEVWNFQFQQAQWADARARARWGHDGAAVQFYAARAVEMIEIWNDVFGAQADDRLVRVIATQTGWKGLEEMILEAPYWVAEDADRNTIPASYFDAYAITGYFSGLLGHEDKVATVHDWLNESEAAASARADAQGLTGIARSEFIDAHRFGLAVERAALELRDGAISGDRRDTVVGFLEDIVPYHLSVAQRYDLDLLMYEGGTHLVGIGPHVYDEGLTEFYVHMNYTPEMGRLYAEILEGWNAQTDAFFNIFVDVAAPSQWGSWGALRHNDDDNPRWQAIIDHRP